MQVDRAITSVKERHGCLYVEGRVLKSGQWLKAAFTVHKPDVARMTRDEFHEFALRQLPEVTEEKRWNLKGEPVPV